MADESDRALERILVVDDDAEITEIAAVALGEIGGYRVEVCASGEEAIARAADFRPDLILLDVGMPGLDGPATLARLRAQPGTARIPAIFVSGDARSGDVSDPSGGGVIGVIVKPFDPLALPDIVAGRWQRHASRTGAALEARLDAMRAQYRARLPERLAELRAAWQAAAGADFTLESLERAHRLAHNLAGSSGAHGHRDLATALREAALGMRTLVDATRRPSAEERARLDALVDGLDADLGET